MLTKWTTRIAVAAICIAALSLPHAPALAQSTTQGGIGGTVEDSTGAVIPNATVTILNNGTNSRAQLVSDQSGYFKAPLTAMFKHIGNTRVQRHGLQY